MKNLSFKPLNLVYNILVLAILFPIIEIPIVFALPCALFMGVVLGFVKSPIGALFAEIQKSIWETDIQEGLYASNAFLKTFSKADKENISGRVVHIPQAGEGGNVEKNRSVLPAVVKQRTDTIVSYQINEFTSDPILIKNADTVELSYDKRASALYNDQMKLNKNVAEDVLLSIVKTPLGISTDLPATSILGTEGAAVKSAVTAGLVKSYTIDDLQRAQNFFIDQDIWHEGQMFALLTSSAWSQMFPASSPVTATYMASVTEEERRSGILAKAYGFNIMLRSRVYTLAESGSFKPSDAVKTGTDVEGVLFYNGSQVEFAEGDIEFFGNMGKAEYYGDVYSFLVRAGARAKREKFEGLMVLKQTPTV